MVFGRSELESGIFMMQRMTIAARQKRAYGKPGRPVRRVDTPREGRHGRAVSDKDLVLDVRSVVETEDPSRPGIMRKRFNSPGAIGMDDVGCIALRRKSHGAGRCRDPGIKSIDQNDSACRRGDGG